MTIEKLTPADIDIGDRLREVDQDLAELIAASFREIGQRTPIQVRKKGPNGKYRLIAGAHRIRAAELAELPHILATVQEVSNHQADLMEIDENLLRADLSVLDRAVFMARRKEVYDATHDVIAHGGDRKSDQFAEFCDLVPERFTKDTANRLGVSERSVQVSIRRAARIGKEVRKALTGTVFANKGVELDALVELEDEAEQLNAVALVLSPAPERPKTLREAVDRVAGRLVESVSPAQRAFDAFQLAWEKHPAFRDLVRNYIETKDRFAATTQRRRMKAVA